MQLITEYNLNINPQLEIGQALLGVSEDGLRYEAVAEFVPHLDTADFRQNILPKYAAVGLEKYAKVYNPTATEGVAATPPAPELVVANGDITTDEAALYDLLTDYKGKDAKERLKTAKAAGAEVVVDLPTAKQETKKRTRSK